MISSQQFVIAWFEYAIGATILLAATKFIVGRLRQPVDRVNLIALSLAASTFVPLLLLWTNGPSLRLGVITNTAQKQASADAVAYTPPRLLEGLALKSEPLVEQDDPQPAVVQPKLTETSLPPSNESLNVPLNLSVANIDSRSIDKWSIAATVLLFGHGLAIVWFFTQWTIGSMWLFKITRRAIPADGKLQDALDQISGNQSGSVRLLVTTEIAAPMVCGGLHTTILIPKSIAIGDLSELRFCLAHEWSHVQSNDLAKWKLTNWCQLLLWYQPLVWTLQRELRVCQDLIADDFAAGTTNEQLGRIQYSELLMSIAKQSMTQKLAGALAFHERSSQLSRRIKALLTNTQSLRPQSTKAFMCMWSVLLLTVSMLVGSIRLSTAQAQEAPTNQPAARQTAQPAQPQKEQPAQAESFRTVRGQVVNAAGEPVPGAKLWLPLQFQPRRIAEATADTAGNFEIKFPVDWISPTIRGRFTTVWAYASGYCIQSQSVFEAISGEAKKEYTIQLPPESNTAYRILKPDGKPLAGAIVKPIDYSTSDAFDNVPEGMQSELSVRTDSNGRVRLPSVELGLLYRIELFDEQFGRQAFRVDNPILRDDPNAFNNLDLQLRPVSSIRGRLVCERQDWTRNVKLYFATEDPDDMKGPHGHAEIVTDDQGHFDIPKIAMGGRIRCRVAIDPKLPVRPLLKENMTLSEGETMELDIPLVNAPLVHGKVVDRSTGKPVAKAEVGLHFGDGSSSDYVIPDENGRYEGRTPPGPVRVQVIAVPDGSLQVERIGAEAEVPADVKEFELPNIEVVGMQEVVGELVDNENTPLPNLLVQAGDGNDHRLYGTAESDERGQFKIRVPIGLDTVFFVTVENLGTIPAQVLKRDPLRIRVKMQFGEKKK